MSSGKLEEGTLIGNRFRVVGLVGTGSFGSVYEATDDQNPAHPRVALKVLHARFANDKSIRARFEREAKALLLLESPRICPLLDWGSTSVGPSQTPIMYLALPFVEGTTLGKLLETASPMEEERAIRIAIGICEGVAAAHAAGILHRDLNPDNVLVGASDAIRLGAALSLGLSPCPRRA